jgi:hypothetical protein
VPKGNFLPVLTLRSGRGINSSLRSEGWTLIAGETSPGERNISNISSL